jgi:hypothetical protein
MAADLPTIIKALESHKAEIEWVAAETLAFQAVLTHFVAAIGSAAPSVRPLVLRAFDNAANEIRSEGGTEVASPRARLALNVIDQIRLSMVWDEPQHSVAASDA